MYCIENVNLRLISFLYARDLFESTPCFFRVRQWFIEGLQTYHLHILLLVTSYKLQIRTGMYSVYL